MDPLRPRGRFAPIGFPSAAAGPAEDLISAAFRGDAAAVQALLAKGADVNAKNNDGVTALMVASENGHLDVVQALLAKGAEVNAKDERRRDRADSWPPSKATSTWCRRCSPRGPRSMPRRTTAATALMLASQNGHLDVVQALLAKGAEVNAKANDGATALMLASRTATSRWCRRCSPRGPTSMPRLTTAGPR